jgi:hypothetical protein
MVAAVDEELVARHGGDYDRRAFLEVEDRPGSVGLDPQHASLTAT